MKRAWSFPRLDRYGWSALLFSVALAGAAMAGEDESPEPDEKIIPGHFIDREVQTRIFFHYDLADEKVRIHHEDGPQLEFGAYSRVIFRRLCRDPVSGLDYLFLTNWYGGRAPSKGQYWYVDPAGGSLKLAYGREQDTDTEIAGEPYRWVSYAGACGWREQEAARQARAAAFDALGAAAGALPLSDENEQGYVFTLPAKGLNAPAVRRQLAALDALPHMERVSLSMAVPHREADAQAWRVLQLTDPRRCPGRSIVLVQDRAASTWRAIYDKAGGLRACYATWMQELHLKDGKLYALVCREGECSTSYAGGLIWTWVELDLETNRGTLIADEPDFVRALGEERYSADPERQVEECRRLNNLFDELNKTRDSVKDSYIRGRDCSDIRFPPMPLSG